MEKFECTRGENNVRAGSDSATMNDVTTPRKMRIDNSNSQPYINENKDAQLFKPEAYNAYVHTCTQTVSTCTQTVCYECTTPCNVIYL